MGGDADVIARRGDDGGVLEHCRERAEERAESRPRRQSAGDADDLASACPHELAEALARRHGDDVGAALASAERAAASVSAVAPL